MIALVYSFLLLTAPLMVAATVVPHPDYDTLGKGGGGKGGKCNTGKISCCDSVQPASSTPELGPALAGGAIPALEALIGINCNPIDLGAIGGNSCSSQTVCCTGNSFNGFLGLITAECNPVDLTA